VPSPIIARADALMHRRRQGDNEIDDIPVLTDSIDQLDEIPVLTEVESIPETAVFSESAEVAQPAEEEAPSNIESDLRDDLIRELTGRIEDRIRAALPDIISSTIREFLIEQEQLENS
jgi:hypothetical protein